MKRLMIVWAATVVAVAVVFATMVMCKTEEPMVEDAAVEEVDTNEIEEDENEQVAVDMALAFAKVESGGNPNARNGECVGLLQISPICVKEVNRLLGGEMFTLADREDPWASVAMFVVIMDKKNPEYDLRKACEIWNPTAGEWYYERVKKAYEQSK